MTQRVRTAIVLAVIILPAVYFGGVLWEVLLSLIGVGAVFELQRMNRKKFQSPETFLALVLTLVVIHQSRLANLYPGLTLDHILFGLVAIFSLLAVFKPAFKITDAAFAVFSIMYVSVGALGALAIRADQLSKILYLVIVITCTDMGAYFIGKNIGKTKLAPAISPNKTIEGSVGGIIVATLLSVLFTYFYPIGLSLSMTVILSILISITGQCGDLIASLFKRHFNVKDSGTIFPGHGGILDRFDSLLFSMGVLWILHII